MKKYFDAISGVDREWSADLLRLALRLASLPYAAATELRNLGFNQGVIRTQSVSCPVLSIGNLTTGGTGKTPTVAWLVRQLLHLGCRPAIISRGYRSLDGEENDEKRLLDDLCPGVPHLQHRHRFTAAQKVLQSTDINAIVLDDGFQHRQLHRDLDFVLIDALNPWGFNALLPRGLLRERLGQLARADVVFITRCELAGDEQVVQIQQQIRRRTAAPILRTAFQATQFVNSTGATLPLEQVAERQTVAFCGIGNPEGFQRALARLAAGISAENFLCYPDHHHYSDADLRRICERAESQQAEFLLTTRKDLVKIRQDQLGRVPLWALDIQLTFLDDPTLLIGMLRTLFPEQSVQDDVPPPVSLS